MRDAHIINKVMQLGRIRENQDHQMLEAMIERGLEDLDFLVLVEEMSSQAKLCFHN